jgi:membrane-bound lytic murein transglycosylase D
MESHAEFLFKRRKRQVVRIERSDSLQERLNPEASSTPQAEPVAITPEPEPAPMLTPAEYDSLVALWQGLCAEQRYEHYIQEYIQFDAEAVAAADQTPDSVYIRRLRDLASPIELPYNYLVKASIARYTDTKYGLMSRVVGLSKYYFPMIEQELLKAGLPIELRAMAIIESALQAQALSRAGAAGLWQFMAPTAKVYGLEVNSLVDERYDPFKATQAACRYLKDLYGIYNNWLLAIAAYNCGPGNVNKAIARSGGKNFWEIYDFLPSETRGYVPAFIGATYGYAYHRLHGITPTEPPMPLAVDTLHVNRILHLGQVASTLENTPIETLRLLNPQYRIDILPATNKSYVLTLPQHATTDYIAHEAEIHSKDSTYLKEYLNPANLDQRRAQASGTIYHRVRRGETLGTIARKYGVSQKNLMKWNGIKNPNRISEGQRLKIIRG